MSYLPHHRRIQAGRTHSQSYDPARYGAAVERHVPTGERIGGVVLAIVLGIAGAAGLLHWWAS